MHAEAEIRSAYSKSYPYIVDAIVDTLIQLRTGVLSASTRCVPTAILAVVLTHAKKNRLTTNFAAKVARAVNVAYRVITRQ